MRRQTLPTFDGAPIQPETFIPAPDGLKAVYAEDPMFTEGTETVESCTVRTARVLGWLVYRDPEEGDDQDEAEEQLHSIMVTLGRRFVEFGFQDYSEFDVTVREYPERAFLGFEGPNEAGHDWPSPDGRRSRPERRTGGGLNARNESS